MPMISSIPERTMVAVRLMLLAGWLALIGELLIHAAFPVGGPTIPAALSETRCVMIQSRCVMVLQTQTFNVSALFWGAIVPALILIFLVFGHVTWRRICPLSLVSQLPRMLGWQRLDNKGNPIRLTSKHWIVRYHTAIQLGFLFVGLCLRLLILNSDSVWLGLWFLGTIAFAMTIGFLYAGKSWCQYFCPMAPVQHIFAEPVGLFTRKAHIQTRSLRSLLTQSPKQLLNQSLPQSPTQSLPQSSTQSMCRTIAGDRSACVACTSTCMDIDAERRYWEWVDRPEMRWTYYGYLGLVLGFFGSFYMYAENWDYYFSGVWTRESTLVTDSVQSGFYFFNRQFYVIKLVAVPIILVIAGLISYGAGYGIEYSYLKWHQNVESNVPSIVLKHNLYSVSTFISFNVFFAFAGRPFLFQLSHPWNFISQIGFTLGMLILSSLWLSRALRRSPDRYDLERLASRWMVQIQNSTIDLPQLLRGQSVHALNREDWTVLRTTLVKVSPKHAPRIDRSLLQTLVDEADQSLAGRYTRYRLRQTRRAIGQWVDREMSWVFDGDRFDGDRMMPLVHRRLHTRRSQAAMHHQRSRHPHPCKTHTHKILHPSVSDDPSPLVRSVILKNH